MLFLVWLSHVSRTCTALSKHGVGVEPPFWPDFWDRGRARARRGGLRYRYKRILRSGPAILCCAHVQHCHEPLPVMDGIKPNPELVTMLRGIRPGVGKWILTNSYMGHVERVLMALQCPLEVCLPCHPVNPSRRFGYDAGSNAQASLRRFGRCRSCEKRAARDRVSPPFLQSRGEQRTANPAQWFACVETNGLMWPETGLSRSPWAPVGGPEWCCMAPHGRDVPP